MMNSSTHGDAFVGLDNGLTGGLLALSALTGLLIPILEVAVRIANAHEAFNGRQIALAVCSSFAILGLVALVIRIVAIPVSRSYKPGRTRKDHRSFVYTYTSLAAAMMLYLTDLAAMGSKLSGGAYWAGVVAGGLSLGLVVIRLGRSRLVRTAVLASWLVCAAGTSYAAWSTTDHLRPWLTRAHSSLNPHPERPNILLIVLDTLRFDRVGVFGETKLTPCLDRFANEGIAYPRAISTAPWTLPMHASLFTGLYPREHRISWGNYALDPSIPVLGELLKGQGYNSLAISNNWLLNRANGFARGFDSFLEIPNDHQLTAWRLAFQTSMVQSILKATGAGLIGQDAGSAITNLLMKQRFADLARSEKPFFAFINYFEAHDPYHPPKSYRDAHLTPHQQELYKMFPQRQEDLCTHACGNRDTFTPEQIDLMAALYDAEVAYQDAIFGELIAALDRAGLKDNTWVFVTSDHGELFGENQLVFHTASAHYQLLHVPLIVRPPGGVPALEISTPVQPVDVFHKIVEIARAQLPRAVTRTFSLPTDETASPRREICISETFGASVTGLYVTQYRKMQTDVTTWMRWITSIYHDGHLLELDGVGPSGLFHVHEDPNMNENLLDERVQVVRELEERFRRWSEPNPAGGAF